jgi:chromosome segregation ATPase
MVNSVKILVISVGFIAFVSSLVYLNVKYNDEKDLNLQLNEVLNETLQEKEQLQKYNSEIEGKIKEQEKKLQELSDVERINNSLQNAQRLVLELNKKLTEMDKERLSLKNANLSLNTRLENTNKEMSKALEDAKIMKAEIAKLDSGQGGILKRKAEDLGRDNELKSMDLAKLKDELVKIQATNQSLIENNKNLEKNLKDLEEKNIALQTKTVSSGKGLGLQDIPFKELQNNVSQLKVTLAQKEGQIKQLEEELERLNSVSGQTRGNRDQQRIIDNLESANNDLNRKISDLEDTLNIARKEISSLKSRKEPSAVSALYENTKEQLDRLSGILIKKELEMDSAKRESLEVKDKLATLQSKLAGMDQELSINRKNSAEVKELERQRITLDGRLNELQQILAKKSELVESLQKNLEYLTTQLAKKEQEFKSIESKFATVDNTTKDEVEKQKARFEEINMLYNSLKMQVTQFSDALNQKELELEQRSKESDSLKEEFVRLQLRYESLEKELADARERQRKTLDDLVAAVKLNTVLQERIMGIPPGKETSRSVSEQQKKAEELKRKIEVILEPQR